MKRTMIFHPGKEIQGKGRRERLRRFTALLSAFMLLFTVNAPLVSAEPLATGPLCGLEEHVHALECYPLVCGLEESEPVTELRRVYVGNLSPHVHTADCRDDSGALACGYVDGEYWHSHNQWCYDEAGNLVCGLKARTPTPPSATPTTGT